MMLAIACFVTADDGHIGLWFVLNVKPNRKLNSQATICGSRLRKELFAYRSDRLGMLGTHRVHFDDLSINELDVIEIGENADFRHSVVLVDGEATITRRER